MWCLTTGGSSLGCVGSLQMKTLHVWCIYCVLFGTLTPFKKTIFFRQLTKSHQTNKWHACKVVKVVSVLAVCSLANPVPAPLHSAPFSRAKRRPAESTHEQSTERAEIPTALTPPLTSHPSCRVLALWRVNWADLWDRRGGHRRTAFPPEPRTSTLRLEEICSSILWPPAFPRLLPAQKAEAEIWAPAKPFRRAPHSRHMCRARLPTDPSSFYSLPAWWNKC